MAHCLKGARKETNRVPKMGRHRAVRCWFGGGGGGGYGDALKTATPKVQRPHVAAVAFQGAAWRQRQRQEFSGNNPWKEE